ncbi:capsular polysaccharide biosynthesis protein [Rhizobium sp. ZW T2_16]|jgi:capsular polysaccharide export protein|uniref:capsular polysaccharide export protein, LipB/KpsS family n=1 Tax=Rhizobium sp. ZW T2_16 TaxID=3378083 RepID=UPI0038553066
MIFRALDRVNLKSSAALPEAMHKSAASGKRSARIPILRQWLESARALSRSRKPPLYIFGFSKWKTFIQDWFPDHEVIIAPAKTSSDQFDRIWKKRILRDDRSAVLSWQYKGPSSLKEFCVNNNISFHYVEDGFIRSIKLGALHTPPMSLTFDCQDMYFSSRNSTDLEDILSNYDFSNDKKLISRAKKAIAFILSSGISKYNSSTPIDISSVYGAKTKKRILVIGQVESDSSISYGCDKPFTNNDLVRLARFENPDADVVYKPHPEVLSGIATKLSDPNDVRMIARILEQDVSLADAFRSVDHVYTITSLSGFEALLRGIHVTTIGCPFYSGWGVTDDRQANPRRSRKLSVEEIFAGAYILYPRYFDPEQKKHIEIEDALSILSNKRTESLSS